MERMILLFVLKRSMELKFCPRTEGWAGKLHLVWKMRETMTCSKDLPTDFIIVALMALPKEETFLRNKILIATKNYWVKLLYAMIIQTLPSWLVWSLDGAHRRSFRNLPLKYQMQRIPFWGRSTRLAFLTERKSPWNCGIGDRYSDCKIKSWFTNWRPTKRVLCWLLKS